MNYGSTPLVMRATTNSGLPISFARGPLGDATACSVSANGVVSVGLAGVCEVVATQAGNQTYAAAAPTTVRFNVKPIQSEAPFVTSISVQSQAITVSYREPGDTGGSMIRAYQTVLTAVNPNLELDPIVDTSCLPFMGPTTGTQPTVTCRIDGLTNGVAYTLRMAAITEFGVGRQSRVSEPFTPVGNLAAVTELTAISDAENAMLDWVAPVAYEGTFLRYDVYVRAPGGSFGTEPLATVDSFNATGTAISIADLPVPQSTESFQISSMRSRSFQIANVEPDAGDDAPNLEIIEDVDPADLVPRYEFMVVAVSDANPTPEDLNTTFLTQQLLTAPAAPNSINAEEADTDIVVGWTASSFDGGSQISGYLLYINGECVKTTPAPGQPASSATCVEFAPNEPFFSLDTWSYSTDYTFAVVAKNQIGLSQPTSFTLTTSADPNPPTGMYVYPGPLLQQFSLKTAAPGQIVTITGTRLNLVQRLWVGGVETTFVLNAANQLSFRVPFGLEAGIYDINVLSEFGRLTVQQILRVMGDPVYEDLPEDVVEQPSAPGGSDLPIDLNPDIDGDGIPNGLDPDIDGDGIPNEYDPNPLVPNNPDEALEEPTDWANPGSGGQDEDATGGSADAGGDNDSSTLALWPFVALTLLLLLGAGAGLGVRMRRRFSTGEEKV